MTKKKTQDVKILPDAAVKAAADDSEAKAEKKQKQLGTSKAVETMFRNALRAELDLITLAATKANIMISLNGVIISALMISGAFMFSSSAVFLIPAGVFMSTAAASIVFAILAASPEKAYFFSGLWKWAKAFFRRRAGFRDLRGFLDRANRSEEDADLNLLIYKDRVQLSRQEYWERMQVLIRDRDEIYHSMSDQLYWLGQMVARKFKMLNISYSIFRWGLLISVMTFVGLKSVLLLFPEPSPHLNEMGIGSFSGIYEPSAVQQLPDGRMLVVEDEHKRAMSILTVSPGGSLIENAVANFQLTRGFGRRLNDLEGLAAGDDGFIYAITSHSSNKNGKRSPSREQLLRFRVKGNSAGDIGIVTTLRDDLAGATALAAAIKKHTGEDIDWNELNIEGLAYLKNQKHLLLGLRDPLAGDSSIIVVIENPVQMFAENAAPMFSDPILLDLQGGGIRSLHFDPYLEAFLIANEIDDDEGNKYSQIWTWSGDPKAAPSPVALPELLNLDNVEAIDSITINGEPRLVFMGDEGDVKNGIPAKYIVLEYDRFME